MNDATADVQVDSFQKKFRSIRAEIARVIVGNETVIEEVITCLLARGHGLIEGVPGTGKTKLIPATRRAAPRRPASCRAR